MLLKCSKTELRVMEAEPLTSCSQNIFEASFEFGEEWANLSKTVIFRSGETAVSVILGPDNRCKIPYEVLREPGSIYVGIYGTGADCILTTVWCLLGIVQPGAEGGEPTDEPTPSVYQQILTLERQAVETAEALRHDAENGVFNGEDGTDGMTPTIGGNGNWFIGAEDTGKPSRGASGMIPKLALPYAVSVVVSPNTMTEIGMATGTLSIELGEPIPGYDNEWDFTVTQGETEQDIVLPDILWGLGMAPSFSAGSTTLCRLYMLGGGLHGEWVSI